MSLSGSAYLLLGMIRTGKRTGYDIKRVVDSATRFFWAASNSQIYPTLDSLERAGLVSGAVEARGERRRKVFELTPAGEEALHEWLTDSSQLMFEQRNEGLLKFFFADALTTEEAIELVRAVRERHELIRAGIAQATPPNRPDRRFGYFTKEYGIGLHTWIIEWCEGMEARLADEQEDAVVDTGARHQSAR